MTTDPIPNNTISLHNPRRRVSEADSCGVDVVGAFELLESHAGMLWVALNRSLLLQKMYFSPSCITRAFTEVAMILPKTGPEFTSGSAGVFG